MDHVVLEVFYSVSELWQEGVEDELRFSNLISKCLMRLIVSRRVVLVNSHDRICMCFFFEDDLQESEIRKLGLAL